MFDDPSKAIRRERGCLPVAALTLNYWCRVNDGPGIVVNLSDYMRRRTLWTSVGENGVCRCPIDRAHSKGTEESRR